MININTVPVSPMQGSTNYQTQLNNYQPNNMINFGSGYNQPYGYQQPYGYNGYNNGGYYNNNYTIYNPYLIAEQQKAAEAQRKERLRQRTDMMKRLSRNVNKALGYDISDDELHDLYDPSEFRTSERDLEIQNTFRLMQIDQYNTNMNFVYTNPLYTAMGRVQENIQKKLDPEMDLNEFLEISGELISDNIKNEVLMKRREINNLYNRSDYQKLIDLRSGGSNFPGTFKPNANIDDMEIQLPEHLKNNYKKRKEKFIEAIINRGGASHG